MSNQTQKPVSRLSSRRLMLASTAAIIGALSMSSVSYAQEAQAPQHTQQERHFDHHGKMNPEKMEKRLERKVNRLLPDATPEQKAKVIAIAKAAFNDLRPLREKSRAVHAQVMKLLAQPTIDRAALEKAREAQLQLADQRSRRVTQAFADAAEVLTPAQRVKLAALLSKHRGHEHHHHGHGHDQAAKPDAKS